MTSSFACSVCNTSHEGLPTDYAWKLPDEVWAIPEPERAQRARWSQDLCRLDQRHFIRCVLYVPLQEHDAAFGWGVWVEVAGDSFDRYLALYESDARGEPAVRGTLANDIPVHSNSRGLPVMVQFNTATQRPTVHVPAGSDHPLARAQHEGMSGTQYHEILIATGALGAP